MRWTCTSAVAAAGGCLDLTGFKALMNLGAGLHAGCKPAINTCAHTCARTTTHSGGITDTGLHAWVSKLTALTALDMFGAHITDNGAAIIAGNLTSLQVTSGACANAFTRTHTHMRTHMDKHACNLNV